MQLCQCVCHVSRLPRASRGDWSEGGRRKCSPGHMPSDILGCLGDGSDHRHWEGFRNRCLAQHTHARALINAKSVGFTAAGASGVYLKTLFEKLNISDELKPKLKLLLGAAGEAVAKGEVEIGLTSV